MVWGCLVPLVLLCVYLFVFRWSWRFFSMQDDYIAVTACALFGAITIGVAERAGDAADYVFVHLYHRSISLMSAGVSRTHW